MPAPIPTARPGDPLTAADSICAIVGCARVRYARGWCRRHYDKWYSHGDPLYERIAACDAPWICVCARPRPQRLGGIWWQCNVFECRRCHRKVVA